MQDARSVPAAVQKRVVKLALLAEKEAQGMNLECDATVECAWFKRPVANPGLRSLQAAMNPFETDALFFVAKADGSGGHTFSRDYDEHQRAVLAYRHGEEASRTTGKGAGVAGGGKAGGPR